MNPTLRGAVLILALAVTLAVAGCGRRAVSRQDDAVGQYLYARDQFYAPAMRNDGEARERLLRRAVAAFQSVIRGFPDERSATTRALSEYCIGLCQMSLGETERARNSFLRTQSYRRFLVRRGKGAMQSAGRATLIAVMDDARRQIRRIDGIRAPKK